MTIKFHFNSIIIQTGETEETYPLMFSSFQQYLPAQKPPKRRRKARKKRETVASLINALIDNIDSGSSG